MRNQNKKQRGFTLIELMVVAVIVVILALLAYPSYVSAIRKSQRNDARGSLLSTGQRLERAYTADNEYPDDLGTIDSEQGYWTVSVEAGSDKQSYVLTADKTSKGIDDSECDGKMKLKSNGQRLPGTGCW